MSDIEELEARIMNLPRQDMARLRDWFLELDHQLWDEQIASDLKAGKLKKLIDEVREEFAQGKAREL